MSKNTYNIPSDTLTVEMDRSPAQRSILHLGGDLLVSDDELITHWIRVYFEKSPSNQLEITLQNESNGGSLSEAKKLAESIDFEYRIEDNKLLLPSHFTIKKGDKWRAQQVRLYIAVPEGMYVERNRAASSRIVRVQEDRQHKFPWIGYNSHIWKMGPNGMIAPDYAKDTRKEYSLGNFTDIRVDGNVQLDIRQGQNFKIVLDETDTGHDLEVIRSGNRLDISTNRNSRRNFRLEITMPDLKELWAIRSNDIEISDFSTDSLHIVNEGEGDIKAFANVKKLDLHLTGRNELEIRGEGGQLNAILSNDADLDAEHFTVKNANMELNNRSTAVIFATDTLWQKVSNSRLTSRRDPVIIEGN